MKVPGDVGLERRVAALVLDHLRIVNPCRRSVCGGVEAADRALDVAKSAKFQTCSPTTTSIRSKTRWYISSNSPSSACPLRRRLPRAPFGLRRPTR
jgi:hypothetical protein